MKLYGVLLCTFLVTGCSCFKPKVDSIPLVPSFLMAECVRPSPIPSGTTLRDLFLIVDQRQVDQLECADRMDKIRLRLQKNQL